MKCADLVHWYTMTHKTLYPPLTFGNPTTKSIKNLSHFHLGMVKDYNNLYGYWFSTLTYWQILHLDTKSATTFLLIKSPQIMVHFYIPKIGSVKYTIHFCQNLSLQVIILVNTDLVPESQNPINYSKIWFKSISNLLYWLGTPFISSLPILELIQ